MGTNPTLKSAGLPPMSEEHKRWIEEATERIAKEFLFKIGQKWKNHRRPEE
jgi:hypothetical protein